MARLTLQQRLERLHPDVVAFIEKKDREYLIARALRWSDRDDNEPDIQPPRSGDTVGFLFNEAGVFGFGNSIESCVAPACSGSVSHAYGKIDRTTTQGARSLYSTRERALRALRAEVEMIAAAKLAWIDAEIEAEQANPTTPEEAAKSHY